MKRVVVFSIGIISWFVLVNVLIGLRDDFSIANSASRSEETADQSNHSLTPRNSILSIRMRGN